MRELSLQSDLENEVWQLLNELVDEHGLDSMEAKTRILVAAELAKADHDHDHAPQPH